MILPNTSAVIRKIGTPFTFLILFASFLYFVPSLMMSLIWYDLKDVNVIQTEDGLHMVVDRHIHRDFIGAYRVTVRTSNGDIICHGMPERPFQYKEDAVLPDPTLLSWWLGSEETLQECIKQGMVPGEYYLDTCQSVRWSPLNIVIARRCVRSNIFTVLKTEDLI